MSKFCINSKTAPLSDHWAIIQFSTNTNYYDKDDYHTSEMSEYTWFDNEKEWLEQIDYLTRKNKSFVPIIAQVPEVVTTVTVAVKQK